MSAGNNSIGNLRGRNERSEEPGISLPSHAVDDNSAPVEHTDRPAGLSDARPVALESGAACAVKPVEASITAKYLAAPQAPG